MEKAQASLESALLSNPAWGTLRAVKEGRFITLDHKLYNLKPNARWGKPMKRWRISSIPTEYVVPALGVLVVFSAGLSLCLGAVPLGPGRSSPP